jgi:hypothetical protein
MKKSILSILFVLTVFAVNAQLQGREIPFYQTLGGSTNIASDTVTNAATNFLTSLKSGGGATSTSIVVSVTKISGTVAGTLTLYGCNTGCGKTTATATAWTTVKQPDLQTAVPTITALDASGPYSWVLSGSPYSYYRVSWTGAGTMAASFTVNLMSH